MPDLSTIRLQCQETWTVNDDGSPGELLWASDPVWVETEANVAFREWDSVLAYVEAVEAGSPPDMGVGEGPPADLGIRAAEETGLGEAIG